MIRESIDQPWREVSWDEALVFSASRLKAIKAEHGAQALGGITSSRCTNEENYLVQKLVRAGFGTNNVDTCARVCHSPTGYGLKTTFGTSAGTQDFDSVMHSDVILVIGANPTDGHPVFASRMKQRLRQGAKLIVIDPRRIDLVKSPHVEAAHHLPLQPGTNVAVLTAMAHVIVTEELADEDLIRERCDWVFLPGSTFLEKNGTFTNAERRIQPVRKFMQPAAGYEDWEVIQLLANAIGADRSYTHPSEILNEIARLTPSFAGVSWGRLDEVGSLQWPVNEQFPDGAPVMHVDGFAGGKGKFVVTDYVPTDEKTGPRFPLLLTTGRILSHHNVGAQTRRTANTAWHPEDLLEMHPTDAENRGLNDGDWTHLTSRTGETTLRLKVTDRVAPGVVYTTFHHPATQANVVTTEFSDWATNCPEYKVTAVQVMPSNGPTDWQEEYVELSDRSRRIAAEPAE